MLMLPATDCSLLVRTDFTSQDAWEEVSGEAQLENADGFRAYLEPVSDPAFDGAGWQAVKAAAAAGGHSATVLFIADTATLTAPGHPVLVVDVRSGKPPFRCLPSELWSIENNLNLANMDWEDFAGATDEAGVFRGFG